MQANMCCPSRELREMHVQQVLCQLQAPANSAPTAGIDMCCLNVVSPQLQAPIAKGLGSGPSRFCPQLQAQLALVSSKDGSEPSRPTLKALT